MRWTVKQAGANRRCAGFSSAAAVAQPARVRRTCAHLGDLLGGLVVLDVRALQRRAHDGRGGRRGGGGCLLGHAGHAGPSKAEGDIAPTQRRVGGAREGACGSCRSLGTAGR
eukprot:6211997-Pleurochrysis_carterae.AAC.4